MLRYHERKPGDVLDSSDVVGIATLFVAIGISGLALYLVRGKARLNHIQSAFAQMTLVPRRRQQFLILLWVEVICFLVGGVFLGLYDFGVSLSKDPDLLFTVAFLGGIVALGGLIWVGFRPRRLSEEEMGRAERDASTVMESIWMVPYRRLDEGFQRRKQR